MSTKKVKDVDSIYSGGSTKRNRIFDDISFSSNVTSARWRSILSCCWKRNRETKPALKEYNPNEWDYIVEKLVVKRVPLSLYATEEDYQEFIEEKNYKESSYGPPMSSAVKEMRNKQVYPAIPGLGSSFHFLNSKTRGDLSNKPSSKNLRFNRDEDLLDEDTAQAGPSNYKRYMSNLRSKEDELENEYLNQFSSLHPDLKPNERPPKDPYPLNPPRSKRSLAEDISEIASTKKTPIAKGKRGKQKDKRDSNVYITVSDTSREMSTVVGEENTPTRDKNVAKHASSGYRKVGSAFCLPFTQKLSNTSAVELTENRHTRQGVNSSHNQRRSSENPNDRNSNGKSLHKESQVKVHYVSPEPYSTNEVAKLGPRELDAGFKSQRTNGSEISKSAENESATEAASYTSDDVKNTNSTAGTTLRWKIIIKHHQPTASQTGNELAASIPESSILPALIDGSNKSKLMKAKTVSVDKIRMENTYGYKNG